MRAVAWRYVVFIPLSLPCVHIEVKKNKNISAEEKTRLCVNQPASVVLFPKHKIDANCKISHKKTLNYNRTLKDLCKPIDLSYVLNALFSYLSFSTVQRCLDFRPFHRFFRKQCFPKETIHTQTVLIHVYSFIPIMFQFRESSLVETESHVLLEFQNKSIS